MVDRLNKAWERARRHKLRTKAKVEDFSQFDILYLLEINVFCT